MGVDYYNRDLISVIIPVYNLENYIQSCLDSVLQQTYHELEIILVDDGSKDRSGAICDKAAENDNRIVVIHKLNGGLSDARNAGLKVCSGKYVTFIDGDDFVDAGYIEYLYRLIKINDADISVCGFKKTKDRSYHNQENHTDKMLCFAKEEALYYLMYQKFYTSSACAKLYKKELFKDIHFPSGKLHEDVAVMYKLFDCAEKIIWGEKTLYYYYQREGSIVNSSFSLKKMDYIHFTNEMMEYMLDKHPNLYRASVSRHISACFQLIIENRRNMKDYYGEYKKIFNEIKKYRDIVILDSNARVRNRAACVLSYVGEDFFIKMIRFV